MRGRRCVLFGMFSLALVVGVPGSASVAAAEPPVPSSISALGDSITRGFNADGFYVDWPSRSWSTGSTEAVGSHYRRLLARNPAIEGNQLNAARTGATVSELPGQAAAAASFGADYVTILVGANDACAASEGEMTSVSAFRAQLDSAMGVLDEGVPDARVLMVSIPDIYRLWSVGKGSWSARTAWDTYDICQSMLAHPASTAPEDEERRARVRQRVVEYNAALAAECAEHASCRYDGGAVFAYPFELSQLSTWDYFHPNKTGQAVLAEESNAAGYQW